MRWEAELGLRLVVVREPKGSERVQVPIEVLRRGRMVKRVVAEVVVGHQASRVPKPTQAVRLMVVSIEHHRLVPGHRQVINHLLSIHDPCAGACSHPMHHRDLLLEVLLLEHQLHSSGLVQLTVLEHHHHLVQLHPQQIGRAHV